MPYIYDLYGFLDANLDAIARELEPVLGVIWVPHDSSLVGDYYLAEVGSEEFSLQSNWVELENEWTEPTFIDYHSLIYVSNIQRWQEIESLILNSMKRGVALLSRTSF